jgi:hypothetical protein
VPPRNFFIRRDTATVNISAGTGGPLYNIYYSVRRNGYEITTDHSRRIYFSKNSEHIGNILITDDKIVVPEIQDKDRNKKREESILREYRFLVEEITKK